MELSPVQAFFEQYALGRATRDTDLIASQYADPYMLADANGTRVIDRKTVLAVFPAGLQLLKTLGHISTTLQSLSEESVDEHYRIVRARLVWRFERPELPIVDVNIDTLFVVFAQEGKFTIVFQQEREDFRDALRSHGIMVAPP
jgi:hypothetical protein